MASLFHYIIANNYRGFELPGIQVVVRENDGAIGIEMTPEGEDADKSKATLSAMFNVEDAEQLRDALNEAIQRAKPKKVDLPSVRKPR